MPLREGAARRQLRWVVADQHRLERVAAPGDVRIRSGRNQTRYSPGELETGVARRPLATGASGAKSGSSRPSEAVAIHRCRGLLIEPCRDLAQLRRARAPRPSIRIWPSNSSAAPLAPSGCSSDCELSNSAPRQSPSREIASIIRCSSRRTDSSACACAKLSSAAMRVPTASASSSHAGAHLERDEARRIVVAGDQAPEPAADHQRGDQRRADAHVLQVLDVDRRHAAQEAQRHVEVAAGDRR